MQSTHEAELDLPALPLAARTGHIVPILATTSLLSVGQLCDADCDVTFTPTTKSAFPTTNLRSNGTQALSTSRLWEFTLPPFATLFLQHSLVTLGTPTSADLVAFAHAVLFSPALSTLPLAWERGILPPIAGLTLAALKRYPPQSVAIHKGHMDQSRQNQRSTKPPATISSDLSETPDDVWPPPGDGKRSHACYAATFLRP